VERVNRELEGVVDVEVEWTGGDLHGRVGEHIVQCKVTRLASAVQDADNRDAGEAISLDQEGRDVIVQCFQLPFSIEDTNECLLPAGHYMRHRCLEPAMCVNTIGSYECLCPKLGEMGPIDIVGDAAFFVNASQQGRSSWEVSYGLASESSCPSSASTQGCCAEFAHSKGGQACRSAFRCPFDPCAAGNQNDCDASAHCARADTPLSKPHYRCNCPHGLMGNGHRCRKGIDPIPKPMVKFDGKTPTEETLKNNYFCGCTQPQVDACEGFPACEGNQEVCIVTSGNTPICACKPGFVNNNDGYGCVDETAPVLKLRHDPHGDHTLRLIQGDMYKEYAVDVLDENAEDYLRSLRITYSKPLPHGCLTTIGEFHVNYTVATPWTSPPYVRVTRRVIIEDIDECSLNPSTYETICPILIPQCDVDAGATCENTIGSYTCKCPKFTTGDGFKGSVSFGSKEKPVGFNGGTSCIDNRKPVIEILGPNPKVFKTCRCGGLNGIMSGKGVSEKTQEICSEQRGHYGSNLKDLIQATAGAELCATHGKPNPKPSDCVKATDHTFRGPIDITQLVKVGNPVQKSEFMWRVPYNVLDKAGNEATTVWRDVIVEEVELYDLENRVRNEVMAAKELEIEIAVKRAVEGERKKIQATECPSCPACECKNGSFDESKCAAYCDDRKISNAEGFCPSIDRFVIFFDFFDYLLSPAVWGAFGAIVFACMGLLGLRFLITTVFNPGAIWSSGDIYQGAGGQPQPANISEPGNGSPTTMLSEQRIPGSAGPQHVQTRRDSGGGIFSPPQNRMNYGHNPSESPFFPSRSNGVDSRPQSNNMYDDSIYQDNPIITPSKRG